MYCYDAAAAMRSARDVLRPGGRMLQIVWGPAPGVWWVPVIELVETRAEYFSAVCPMMFFYGLPGVLPRMAADAGLDLTESLTLDATMAFADVDEAVDAAIHGCPLAGLYRHRLTEAAQDEVRGLLVDHVARIATPAPEGIRVPATAAIIVAERPA